MLGTVISYKRPSACQSCQCLSTIFLDSDVIFSPRLDSRLVLTAKDEHMQPGETIKQKPTPNPKLLSFQPLRVEELGTVPQKARIHLPTLKTPLPLYRFQELLTIYIIYQASRRTHLFTSRHTHISLIISFPQDMERTIRALVYYIPSSDAGMVIDLGGSQG